MKYHTSPQLALHFRACIEHSKRAPTASNKSGNPSGHYVLVGISFSRQKLLKACTTETASIITRSDDMTDASTALLSGKEYVFSEAEMSLHYAFRLRAQRVYAERPVTLFWYHLAWGEALSLARRLRRRCSHRSLRYGHAMCCPSTVGRPCTPWPSRWTMAGRRRPL